MSSSETSNFLEIAETYLIEKVVPKASEIEKDPQLLSDALQGLGKRNLLGLKVSENWGGKALTDEEYGLFQQLIARYSGTLAFLQTQHQSACGILMSSDGALAPAVSDRTSLKSDYLPYMVRGEILVGVGFSQIRRLGKPIITATSVEGGYELNGVVPWITGWGIFSEFIIAATLPDGGVVFGIVPFQDTQSQDISEHRGVIKFSPTAQLAAMGSTNTVSANLDKWFLPQEKVVSIKPAGWIHESDRKNILKATYLITGCAFAGLDIIESISRQKSLPFIKNAFNSLQKELNECCYRINQTIHNPNTTFNEKLKLRAWTIDLANRIAHAAVTVSSGAANYAENPAQRVYREALVFTVSGQNSAIMEATLDRLVTDYRDSSSFLGKKVVHLSHVIKLDIPQWEGDPPVEFKTVAELGKDGYYLRQFSIGEHSATHINAAKSFYEDGISIDEYPAESLVKPAIVIDVYTQAQVRADYLLSIADVEEWEKKYGRIPNDSIVLLYTGWQEKWCGAEEFFNQDDLGEMHFPGFSYDAVKFLLNERQIAGIGIDTHGVDSGKDTEFVVNRLILKESRIVLENLTNLHKLPPLGTTLVIGILRLDDGSGSPAGVFGFY
ncbi:MAG: cyclase family protein [Cyanobacteria bacterium P01_A01_bin.45]